MAFFSVIIPSYNRKDRVCNAVDSVLNQTYEDFELILVDDGSTDETLSLLGKYESKIKIIASDHGGVSRARNKGIKLASGKYIALLDSDDLWLPEKLEKQYLYIEENPHISVFQCQERWVRNGKRVNPAKKHKKPAGDIFLPSLNLCLVSPSAVVIKRDLFDIYGFFDENMAVCEDYDLWLRMARREEFGMLDEYLTIKHGGHEDQLSHREWGMDRFRVFSLLKLLNDHSIALLPDQYNGLIDVLLKKVGILYDGAVKRDNQPLIALLQHIRDSIGSTLERKLSSSIDYSLLLKG